jgi:hypothetical protein
MFTNAQSLLPMACGMRAWTGAVAVVLSVDSRRENEADPCEEVDVAEYAIGTPHDPRVRS